MEKNRIRALRSGDTTRISYSKINEVLEMPNLIEVQKNSYQWFLDEGLKEVFEDISPITDFSGNLILEFIDFSLDSEPKYSIEECRERDATYAASLRVKARLYNRELDELKEQEIFMGDFPLMTETGTFIINGAERVIVSQLVRSPGIYYASEFDKVGKKLLSSTVIPNRGAWLEYETDSNDVFYVRVDRTRKVPVSVLIRAMGVGSDAEIIELFGEEPKILATLEKDVAKSYEEGLIEIYKKLRPGEPPTVESSASLLNGMLFDPKRYDLAKVGRYKFNKKLALRNRIRDAVLAENVVDPMTGEVIAEEGAVLTLDLCDRIQDSGAGYLYIMAEEKKVKILSNQTVKIDGYLEEFGLTAEEFGIKERVYYPMLAKLLEENPVQDLDSPKIPKTLPHYLTLEESKRLLSVVDGKNKERDYCILCIFLNCGLRISELVGLNLQDDHGDSLRILGKGSKERVVYLNDACREALDRYLAVRSEIAPPRTTAMFLSNRRTRISCDSVQVMVKKNLTRAGLDASQYSTHKLRHTAATLMLQNGVDVRTLQEVLGHEHLNTTQIYTHVDNEQLRTAAAANPLGEFSPGENSIKKISDS